MTESTTSLPEEHSYDAKAESSSTQGHDLGTTENPFIVEWLPNDPSNPM